MNQVQAEIEGHAVRDLGSLEAALKTMWEKARAAADLIAKLQSERMQMQTAIADLEKGVTTLRSELSTRDLELKRLRAEHAQLSNLDSKNVFSEEEKEMFRVKIKDLISRINSHL